ncbi:MAG: sugar transferase [Pseudomonadota bacterium]
MSRSHKVTPSGFSERSALSNFNPNWKFESANYSSSISKRVLDLIVAGSALLVFAFPMIVIFILLALRDGFPIFYGHERIGKDGRRFKCLKFRTMVKDSDEQLRKLLESDPMARAEWESDHKLKNDPRIHKIGAILRKSSLDELPQLFNVLRGDMSIVGPRPIVQAEAEKYGVFFVAYKSVKPGLTGLWQVSGRSNTTYRRRVALDLKYTKSASFVSDVLIIFKTAWIVVLGRGSC